MKELKEIKEIVLDLLVNNPKTRDNDIELIYQVVKRYGLSTDLKDLKKLPNNMFESVRRCRCKLQNSNPNLAGSERVKAKRQERQELFRKLAKGV